MSNKRAMKRLARLYAASIINNSKECFSNNPDVQKVAAELAPYLQEVADELLQKAGEVDFVLTLDEAAKKLVLPFRFTNEPVIVHAEGCELGDNHKDCPACIENEKGT